MIVLERLSARAGQFRLRDVSLQVGHGEVLVVLGPSGAGKSVLLQVLTGLRPACGGRVLVDGTDVTHFPPERRRVAWVPQTPVVFPHLSVWQNILLGSRGVDQNQVKDVARLLHVEHLLGRSNVRGLSGGEAQRIALARAILTNPAALALDECFASLDPPLRKTVRDAFKAAQRTLEVTTVLVTHDREEAFSVADRIAILMGGVVHQVGSREEIWYRPVSWKVAEFLGVTNRLPVDRVSPHERGWACHVGKLLFVVPADQGGPPPRCQLGFSEEDVVLFPGGEAVHVGADWLNVAPALVREVQPLGHRADLLLSLGIDEKLRIRARIPQALVRQMSVQPGARVSIGIPSSALRILPGTR